jgi:hypothetical protein
MTDKKPKAAKPKKNKAPATNAVATKKQLAAAAAQEQPPAIFAEQTAAEARAVEESEVLIKRLVNHLPAEKQGIAQAALAELEASFSQDTVDTIRGLFEHDDALAAQVNRAFSEIAQRSTPTE